MVHPRQALFIAQAPIIQPVVDLVDVDIEAQPGRHRPGHHAAFAGGCRDFQVNDGWLVIDQDVQIAEAPMDGSGSGGGTAPLR